MLELAPRAAIVHYAGHAKTRYADPWASYLEVAGRAELRPEDIVTRRWSSRLVVLGACRTGDRGRGLQLGLPEAWLAAGAQRVVAATGDLPDEGADEFLLRFYREGGAERPTRALALAAAAHPDVGAHFRLWGRR